MSELRRPLFSSFRASFVLFLCWPPLDSSSLPGGFRRSFWSPATSRIGPCVSIIDATSPILPSQARFQISRCFRESGGGGPSWPLQGCSSSATWTSSPGPRRYPWPGQQKNTISRSGPLREKTHLSRMLSCSSDPIYSPLPPQSGGAVYTSDTMHDDRCESCDLHTPFLISTSVPP
ncbi:hypothetical protein BO71DRAFT_406592 [Aspergillus ellipticus CBS 707.79]|uniref:Secreted protein n=1 Tax=Aspergillus ellipticus CBS 707.79 TaxID=1448320 RepID=A0A319F079_9EURO|nr:hypothetical protein BO71DRAFT_406592 [Aspergillus ellipticus CBS 707.79]